MYPHDDSDDDVCRNIDLKADESRRQGRKA
jgi:hypothetical protein